MTDNLGFQEEMTPMEYAQRLASLSAEEQAQMLEGLIELLDDDPEIAGEMILLLSEYTEAPLADALIKMIEVESIFPACAFRRGTEDVRNLLLEVVANDDDQRPDALIALAWIDGDATTEAFVQWREQAPAWLAELEEGGWTLERIAQQAGWEFGSGGGRRRLTFDSCFELVQIEGETESSAVAALPHPEACPWCKEPLTILFSLALSQLELEVGPTLPKSIEVLACEACVMEEADVFGKVGHDGRASWHSASKSYAEASPDEERESERWERIKIPSSSFGLGEARPASHAISESMPASASQIGGLPCWIQDAHYPSCPDCERTMTFIAQLDRADIEEGEEGIFYGFLCRPCGVTATQFQMS